MDRPENFRFHNGDRAWLPFSPEEYDLRLAGLRAAMREAGVEAAVLTSMHSIAYYSGFLHCSFGRSCGLVVTDQDSVTVSAGIDGGQPWRRSHGDNIIYTDWGRDNFWHTIAAVAGSGRVIGIEADHLTLLAHQQMAQSLKPARIEDLSGAIMRQRIIKSQAERDLIRAGAAVADIGGHAIHDAIREGLRELDVAMVGRDAMELEIARRFPQAEYRDTWVWFQSGINTDGAHNPLTSRELKQGDILSMNCFPMIAGYHVALKRTMFLGAPDDASLALWETNIGAHEYGISLLKPGISCAEVTARINDWLAARDLPEYRSFGHVHSFGILSHHCGPEAGLELRQDIDPVLAPDMVISMEPMLTIPEGRPGAGGYREHDILIVTETGAEDITQYPYGPGYNVIH